MKKITTFASLRAASKVLGLGLLLFAFSACSSDDDTVNDGKYGQIATQEITSGNTQGMYVLNEGSFGGNNSSLGFLDFRSGNYYPNVLESGYLASGIKLGDTGNDIQYINGKLWIAVNASHKVEVIDARSGKIEKMIDVPNCRNIAYSNGFVYVSSYVVKTPDEAKANSFGAVYKIKESDYTLAGQTYVGYQPEGLAVVGNKLYVANSGGYTFKSNLGYEHTISVIDLNTFNLEKNIDVVAPNLKVLKADKNGTLWVTSQGDYGTNSACLLEIKNDQVVKKIDKPVSNFDFDGNNLIYYAQPYKAALQTGVIDINTGEITNDNLISDTKAEHKPTVAYGIAINPDNKNIYLTDAPNYTSNGNIFVYTKDGKYKFSFSSGGISPAHIAFLPKN